MRGFMRAAGFRIDQGPQGPVLALSGDWTAAGMGDAGRRLLNAMRGQPFRLWDIVDLGRMDTAGAFILLFFYRLLAGYFFVEGDGGHRRAAWPRRSVRRTRRIDSALVDD